MLLRFLLYLSLALMVSTCGSTKPTNPPPATIQTATTINPDLNWIKLREQAEKAEAQDRPAEAADYYYAAWVKKPNKEELLEKAAELYERTRNYRNAAEAYQYLPALDEDDPLRGLRHGRLLKQDGQYEKANRVLTRFLDTYNESDRSIVEDLARAELDGIILAQSQAGRVNQLLIDRPEGLNSVADEFGAIPVGLNRIYFSADRGGQRRLFESRKQGKNWSNARTPSGFPVIVEGEFGKGSISADGQRFYFTICSADERAANRCEIFMCQKLSERWGEPVRLSDMINMPDSDNTDPQVCTVNGREVLFFASNRSGSRGGYDLWYSQRDLGRVGAVFSAPANVGPTINTLGDERSPYYDEQELILYFSSNGHPSLGGQDVFKATGRETNWSRPENMGLPINSVADDLDFAINLALGDGYLSSNRAFAGIKNTTADFDLFEVNLNADRLTVRGAVYDNRSGNAVAPVNVKLFQIASNGREELMAERQFDSNEYIFELISDTNFRIEVEASGFAVSGYRFTTDQEEQTTYGQPLFLTLPTESEKEEKQQPDYPAPPTNPTEYPDAGTTNTGGDEPAEPKITTPSTTPTPVTTATALSGRYYKVQISAQKDFNPSDGKYEGIRAFGSLKSEPIEGRDISRITVGPYLTVDEAKAALANIQSNGFPSAFAVRYDDGVRYGRVNF
ncbi:MAG: SPOR domain-containing protein [Bacteroidota bacterium]